MACRADGIAARVEGTNTGSGAQVEAARSDAPDAFQGLFAALEEACRAKRLSVDAGNFAVVSRSFAAAREVGACADDAAPFRGAAPADVAEACLRSLDAHAATERLGALEDFAVYAASDVVDRADADELLRLAEDQWTASAAAGDATNDYRTSETASLRDDASRASKAVDRVAARAAALFGLPRSGSRVVPVSSPIRHRREGKTRQRHTPAMAWRRPRREKTTIKTQVVLRDAAARAVRVAGRVLQAAP